MNRTVKSASSESEKRLVHYLQSQRQASIEATAGGQPTRTSNPFFGVGPITDMTRDETDARLLRLEFDAWIESNYPKFDDRGNVVGRFTTAELARGMHRGYPADKVLLDTMREIHRYFGFPKNNRMAVGLGGGHSGFTVCALHLMNANDVQQKVFVDTPKPETEASRAGGFFRQSWATQLVEMQRYAKEGDESRIEFSESEGAIPTADELTRRKTKLFIGVGHETTGATTYSEQEVRYLMEWIDRNPVEHHAVIDATSMLGAMPWANDIVQEVIDKCCMFMPFQKAIGGISGYFVISLTPDALNLVNKNQDTPSWSIPRQLKLAVPKDPSKPLNGKHTTSLGPLYDPEEDRMLGGIINTFSTLAFAETTFGLLRAEKRIGSVSELNQCSARNRQAVADWVSQKSLFDLGVADAEKRGAAVTLVKVTDDGVTDPYVHERIISKSKQLLGYEGITHVNGDYEKGLDVARYVNVFPGTPGDYRAWIGGVRSSADIIALLDNIEYAYHRAKIVVMEEELARYGVEDSKTKEHAQRVRFDDPERAYKVLIADLVGLKFDAQGKPDPGAVRAHIEARGGVFHLCRVTSDLSLAPGKIHFFYQPELSTADELKEQTDAGQYDAVIAAATFLPETCVFELGGVRIGAGTGNFGSSSWGGGNGVGGAAPLMNTPSFNSRATAQMVMKALLRVCPNLPVERLHGRVAAGDFDTGKNLSEFPTEKLEGKRIAIIGFGNIGREVAKLAKAFGMQVVVYARSKHKQWIESEGFSYASSVVEAASGANIISPHTGLGSADAGTFTNVGLIDREVLDALADGAIVINYDRGEIVDVSALDHAMQSGKVAYAAIDADIFKDAETGTLSGPMLPYQQMLGRYADRMELLPHAAADTEHVSRVDGAKQAVNQIFDAIQYRSVTNLVGDLPPGFVNSGAKTVTGVGRVNADDISIAAALDDQLSKLRYETEFMASFWGAVQSTTDSERRRELIDRYGAELLLSANRYVTRLAGLGLQGPYGD